LAEEKYIVFSLDNQKYGIKLSGINGIEQNYEIIRVPKGGQFIKGIVHLRSEIIPVYDLKKKFDIETGITKKDSQLIVVDVDGIKIGFEADAIIGIIPVDKDDIKDVPPVILNEDTEYLENIVKVNYADNKKCEIMISIDVNGLISDSDMAAIRQTIEEAAE